MGSQKRHTPQYTTMFNPFKPDPKNPNNLTFTINRKIPLIIDPAFPTQSWQKIRVKYQVDSLAEHTLASFPDEKPANSVRIVCISDVHNRYSNMPRIPPGDILVISGDLTMAGSPAEIESFIAWVLSIDNFQHIVFTAGNHDISLDTDYYKKTFRIKEIMSEKQRTEASISIRKKARELSSKNIHYLENESVTLNGLKFWGSPITPEFCNWSFAKYRGLNIDEVWEKIPDDTDIVITHGPPAGIGDINERERINCGCVNLLWHVSERVKPKLHIFGHIHEDRGVFTDGTTNFVNCAICTRKYRPENFPIIVDVKL